MKTASTATEIADDAAPLLPLLLLFEDGVGLEASRVVEVVGGTTTVGGPLVFVEGEGEGEGVPRNVPDGLFVLGVLVFVRLGGGELSPRLHWGLPAASREQVYPGASEKKLIKTYQANVQEVDVRQQKSSPGHRT